jgi:hypothetical protein
MFTSYIEIGRKLGPFDLAMVPIWSGATLTFLGKMGYKVRQYTPSSSRSSL